MFFSFLIFNYLGFLSQRLSTIPGGHLQGFVSGSNHISVPLVQNFSPSSGSQQHFLQESIFPVPIGSIGSIGSVPAPGSVQHGV